MSAIIRLGGMTQRMEMSLPEKEKNQPRLVQKKFDQVYDLLLDCSQLRRRVSDHTTFAVCSKELTDICQEIERLFEGLMAVVMGKKSFPNINMLQEKNSAVRGNVSSCIASVGTLNRWFFCCLYFSLESIV